jgi:SpoVK/Ycf46/Vps4 family AAA+-type ATPase
MKTKMEKKPLENPEEQTRYVLIFNELAKAQPSDVDMKEIDAIEEVRRIVSEVTDERPIFMTST